MGYIYILSNSKLEGKIKVGKTASHPEIRAKQLNRNTGTYGKYVVEWFEQVEDERITEKLLHHTLRDFHTEKELFLIELKSAIKVASFVIQQIDNIENKLVEVKSDDKNKLVKLIKNLTIVIKYLEGSKLQEVINRISILEAKLKLLES